MQRIDRYPSAEYFSSGLQLADSDTQAQYYSNAYYAGERSAAGRKRKVDRACDYCRKRKTKCDGPSTKDHICTNCLQNRQTCSYVEMSKPRGPPKAYVTALEDRMEKMESLLMRLRPDADLDSELGPPVVRDSWKEPASDDSPPPQPVPSKKPSGPARAMMALSSPPPAHRTVVKKSAPDGGSDSDSDAHGSDINSSEDDIGELSLIAGVKRLTVHGLRPTGEDGAAGEKERAVVDHQLRFHGKSSQYKLIGAVRRLKEQYAEEVRAAAPHADAASDAPSCASAYSQYASAREQYWQTPQWELEWEGAHLSDPAALPALAVASPPDDLARALIDLFFEHVNAQWPLLRRPTFERQRRQELHTRDVWFACLCQCVFAVASRWSHDPRVLPEPAEGEAPVADDARWHKAGWKFFETAVEIHQARRSIVTPAGLFEVQTLSLLTMYLRGSEYEAASWLYLSVGLRKAQDVGAHRRKVYSATPDPESELWKRAFWVLVVLDRVVSASLGRDCCSREEEFDIDFPEEVDDEYWENEAHPELAFKQPTGKPSMIAAFNARIKLSQILAFALRTVGASDKSKSLLGLTGRGWKEKVVTELNSALTDWVKNIPEHLRWAMKMENPMFAKQSATLFTAYYLLQILIYRPFMPPPCSWAPTPCRAEHWHPHVNFPFPASALCTNATRSFARIAEQLLAAPVLSDVSVLLEGAHVMGAVAIMCVYELKSRERHAREADVKPPPPSVKPAVDSLLKDVQTMLNILERVRVHWGNADKMIASLKESLPDPDEDVRLRFVSMDSDAESPAMDTRPIVQPMLPQVSTPSSATSFATSGGDWSTSPMPGFDSATSFDWSSPPLSANSAYALPGSMDYSSYSMDHLAVPSLPPAGLYPPRDMGSFPPPQSQRNVRQRVSARPDLDALAEARLALPAGGSAAGFAPHYGLTPDTLAAALARPQRGSSRHPPAPNGPWEVPGRPRGMDGAVPTQMPPSGRGRNPRLSVDTSMHYGSPDLSEFTLPSLCNQAAAGVRRPSAQGPTRSHPYARASASAAASQLHRSGYAPSPMHLQSAPAIPGTDTYMGGADGGFFDAPMDRMGGYSDQFSGWGIPNSSQNPGPYHRGQSNQFGFGF